MITTVNGSNSHMYEALWAEAEDVLMGYKRVYTFDVENSTYYIKNQGWEELSGDIINESDVYAEVTLTNANDFVKELRDRGALYIRLKDKDGEPIPRAEGFDPRLGITTIEEYYSWIKNLGDIDRKYTILPLDEDVFEINANTRAINIPPNFRKNGIAVQGDEIAEVLYFKVDRYFDYMDLNNADIFIQWEATSKGADGIKVIKGVSPEYVRDIESEPGKLIFGWALSTAITNYPGTLKFSVRFYEWKDNTVKNEIAYNYGTLTAQAMINPSLNYDLTEKELTVDDVGERIIDRLENSSVVGGYLASSPEFIIEFDGAIDLVMDLDEETGIAELQVQARSTDAGEIAYDWMFQEIPEEDPSAEGDIRPIKGYNTFREVPQDKWTDKDMDPSKNYYFLNGDLYQRYAGAIPPNPEEWDKAIYEKVSQYDATTVGKYWVKAVNRVGSAFKSTASKVCVIPRPTFVTGIISPGKDTLGKVILLKGESGAIIPAVLKAGAANKDGKLTYEWYYDSNKEVNAGESEGGFTWVGPEVDEAGEPITIDTLTTPREGHYKVKIINNRNKEQTSAFSDIVRVTLPAEKPDILELDAGQKQFNNISLSDENCPFVILNDENPIFSDAYTAQWFKLNDLTGSYYPVSEDEENQFTFNPLNIPDNVFIDNGDEEGVTGSYKVVVTNHVNGSSATSEVIEYIVY